MNVSNDKMEKIEVLPVKPPASVLDDQIEKLKSSAPIRINVPIYPSIETIGALCELETVEDSESNQTPSQTPENDNTNNKNDKLPKSIEELILFEHNYAANLSWIYDGCKSKEETQLEEENSIESPKVVVQFEQSISTNVDKSEFVNVSPPVRRSRRQIEKLEREQVEKDAASNISSGANQNSPDKKEKLVTPNEKDIEKHSADFKSIEEISDLVDSNKALTCHLNYKNFSEFKKRHLKIVIEDCQSEQNKNNSDHSDASSNISEKIQSNLNDCGSIDNSNTAEIQIPVKKDLDHDSKSKVTLTNKVVESECKGSREKKLNEVPRLRKRKHPVQLKTVSVVENPEESKVVKEKLELSPKKKLFVKTKVELSSESKKDLKLKLLSSSDKSSESIDDDVSDTIQSVKRKKCMSFSDELIAVNKCEALERKRRISVDIKDSGHKITSNPSLAKSLKRKVIRRENSRLAVSQDEPPLFSSPDVMIKVKTDDSLYKKEDKDDSLCKKEEKEVSLCKKEEKEVSLCKKEEKEDSLCKMEVKEDSLCKKEEKEDSLCKKGEKDALCKKEDKADILCQKEEKADILCQKEEKADILCQKEEKEDDLCKKEKIEDTLCEKEEKEDPLHKKQKTEDSTCKKEEKDTTFCKKEGKDDTLYKLQEKEEKSHLSSEYNVLSTVSNNSSSATREQSKSPKGKKIDVICEELIQSAQNIVNSLIETEVSQEIDCTLSHENSNLKEENCNTLDSETAAVSVIEKCSLPQVDCKVLTDTEDIETSALLCRGEKPTVDKDEEEHKLTNTNIETSNTLKANAISSESGEMNENNPKPERKSRRLIKKKEFFDVLNTSANKKVGKKRIKVEKDGCAKKLVFKKLKSKLREKDEDSDALNTHSDSEADSSEEDDPKKLWCICRKPHNSRFMIQCDKCEDWFHGSCVGITKQYGRQLEKQKKDWNCPSCHMRGIPMVSGASLCEKETQEIEAYQIFNEKCTPNEEFSPERQKISAKTFQDKIDLPSNPKHNPISPIINHKNTLSKYAIIIEKSEVKVEGDNANTLKVSKKHSKFNSTKALDVSMSPKKSLKATECVPRLATPTKPSATLKDMPRTKKETTAKIPADKSSLPVNPKKTFNLFKEKKNFSRKSLNCINCQTEAMPNSCYCSTECLEKYATECLKNIRESKEGPKGIDFDDQRLVVLDRLRGSVITSEHGPTAREIVSWLKSHPSFMIACSPGFVPSSKRDTASQKKESDVNCSAGKKPDDDAAKITVRLNVRKTLKNILIERCKNSGDIKMPEDDIQKIAVKIEEELQSFFKDNSFKYRAKYRSLMFNIKDPRNQGLFRKILTGAIQPDRLVRMSSEELASMELARWREQENQHLLDMIKRVQLEHQSISGGLLLKKTHKGEVEIEDDLTNIIEQDVPKIVAKDVSEEVEPEKEVAKDTTHLHRSHLFDLNCKICTGKVVPPPTDENVLKKVRVAHSISVDVSSSNTSDISEKPSSKTMDGKSPVSSAGEDSMDQEPTSTVSIGSPDISVKSHTKESKIKVLSVWKGFIFMQDVAKFVTSAYKVSGQTDQLQSDLPDTVQVCGRIIPDQVWEYLGKIKQSGNKELIVIRFQAANEEEAVTYHSFYSYLSTRKRYGVVSNYSKKIKDFYILPLAATSPVPMVLVPFDGPGLPSPRPHLLLGVIVRHKLKQMSLPVVPKPSLVSKSESENVDGSYTPPHEPRSYTPPLPAFPSSSNISENETNTSCSPVAKVKISEYRNFTISTNSENVKNVTENNGNDEHSDLCSPEKSDSVLSIERDEDKPYDPEQDVPCIPLLAQTKKSNPLIEKPAPDNLESHIKILDALTRQVEETDRQVNALKQLISHPEDDAVLPTTNTQPLDINSIAESGMSSFLDLPESLQDIFNTVRLKSHEKDKETEMEVDMQRKKSFVKHTTEPKQDITQHSLYKGHNSLITNSTEVKFNKISPTTLDDKNSNSLKCPSDPRIKLRTNFQDAFASNEPPSEAMSEKMILSKKQLVETDMVKIIHSDDYKSETPSSSGNQLSPVWSCATEPAPSSLECADSMNSQQNVIVNTIPDNASVTLYSANNLGPHSSHVGSGFRSQPPPSFQTHLPPGFSVHTPPPNMKHFPPPPIIASFPPPTITTQVLSSEGNNNSLKESWQPLQLSKHQVATPQWDKTIQQEMLQTDDSHYYPPGVSHDYLSENMYKINSSNPHWTRPSRFVRGQWNKNHSRGNRQDSHRRGRIGIPYRRNRRN